MNPIAQRFQELRTQGRRAFIPFVPAGDPSLAATGDLVRELAARGADFVEIGFPYSDPLADGPVIQASYTRALKAGLRMEELFIAARQWAQNVAPVPLLAMVAYSLVFRRGVVPFLEAAKSAGFGGLIIPDLPLEEASDQAVAAAKVGLALCPLVTPTTPPERAAEIAAHATGFLYVVSVTGITGERAKLSADLDQQLAFLRSKTGTPLCIGFGISTPEQVRTLGPKADGLIVGSALVKHLESTAPWPQVRQMVGQHAVELRAALDAVGVAPVGQR